jgi:hypothetical protein
MNCQRFESIASELARNRMMETDVRGEALAHTAECASCLVRLRNEEMLTRGLRAVAVEMNSVEAPVALEARLLSAFRQPQVVVPITAARDRRLYWLAAVAALLLIVFSLITFRWRNEQPAPRQANVTSPTPALNVDGPAPEQSQAPKQPTLASNSDNKPKHKPRRNFAGSSLQAKTFRTPARDVNSNHASEVATEFMPLGYLNAAALQDGGQIVRVELPRTTLASFGLPVNMDRYNEKVKADVLLGVDGMAHAIRFVQEKRLQ